MTMCDPVADYLTRIRNAQRALKRWVMTAHYKCCQYNQCHSLLKGYQIHTVLQAS